MAMTEAIGAVRGPALWYGAEMARRESEWLRHLTPAEITALDETSARLAASDIDITAIGPRDFAAPALEALVAELRDAVLHGRGFIMLRGMKVQDWSRRQCAIA